MLLKLTILPGDGIGPEVTEQAVLVLQAVADGFGHQLQAAEQSDRWRGVDGCERSVAGGYDRRLAGRRRRCCWERWAILLSIKNPGHLRPEAGLLRIRRELGAYANLRPAVFFPALEDLSLRAEFVRGTGHHDRAGIAGRSVFRAAAID